MFGSGQTEVLGNSPIGPVIDQEEQLGSMQIKIVCSMKGFLTNGMILDAKRVKSFCAAVRFAQLKEQVIIIHFGYDSTDEIFSGAATKSHALSDMSTDMIVLSGER